MILPNTEPDLVPVLLDRVQQRAGLRARVPELLVRCRAVPRTKRREFDELVELADRRLYEAKERS